MARERTVLFWLGCAVLLTFAAVAALAPALAPHDPRIPTGRPLSLPSADHLLGTNDLGQDVLGQLIYGARSTLVVAGAVAAISTSLSWLIGLTAGFVRRAEGPLIALTDLLLALPDLPLYLLLLTILGPTRGNMILALGLCSWPAFARVVRSIAIGTRTMPYVEASHALGARRWHIIRRHLVPSTLDILPTNLIVTVRFAVFTEATLAFMGLGSGDSASWGMMLSLALGDPLLFSRPVWPWLVLPPTIAIALLLVATVWVSGGIAGYRAGSLRAGSGGRTADSQPSSGRAFQTAGIP